MPANSTVAWREMQEEDAELTKDLSFLRRREDGTVRLVDPNPLGANRHRDVDHLMSILQQRILYLEVSQLKECWSLRTTFQTSYHDQRME